MRMTIIAMLLIVGGTAYSETAQERVARRVAEKYPVKVKEALPRHSEIITIRGCEYIKARQTYGYYVYTHLGNCTNHAPTVVTNYVTVTNECSRQHWPDVIDPGMGKDAYQLELTDQTGGIQRISFPSNWFNTPTTLLNADDTAKRLCELRGHTWQSGCGMMGCAVIHGGPVRHCTVCGKTETQTVGEWK